MPTTPHPWDVLPGVMRFSEGTKRDYLALARHHYRLKPPATFAVVRVARYLDDELIEDDGPIPQLAAVAVLSYPVPMVLHRIRHFGLDASDYGNCLRFANRNIRTVSRIVVHPRFRSCGLAVELVKQLVARCPTPYVDSSASMGAFGTFLEQAGFTRIADATDESPAYFLLKRSFQPSENP